MTVSIKAQNYQISFSGSGESTVVDNVLVENLTQGTSVELPGSEILNLVGTLRTNSYSNIEKGFKIYPNPMQQEAFLEFYNESDDDVRLEIFSIEGKLISSKSEHVYPGKNVFDIKGLSSGVYIVKLTTSSWQHSSRIISQGFKFDSPTIIHAENTNRMKNKYFAKNNQNIVQMQYDDGDVLLLEATSGTIINSLTLVPTESQTLNFEFNACTDADGNNYASVNIGNQIWMAENLNYQTGNSWCYDGDIANCDLYGRLYDWQTALTVCPSGWHLPSDAEWTELTDHLGGLSVAGGKMKSTSGWYPPNVEASNSSGFSGLPGGFNWGENYLHLDIFGFWWSSTEYDVNPERAWHRYISFGNDDVTKHHDGKVKGFSCRCVKD